MPWVREFREIPLERVDFQERPLGQWEANKGRSRSDYDQLMRDLHEIHQRQQVFSGSPVFNLPDTDNVAKHFNNIIGGG